MANVYMSEKWLIQSGDCCVTAWQLTFRGNWGKQAPIILWTSGFSIARFYYHGIPMEWFICEVRRCPRERDNSVSLFCLDMSFLFLYILRLFSVFPLRFGSVFSQYTWHLSQRQRNFLFSKSSYKTLLEKVFQLQEAELFQIDSTVQVL